MYLSLYVLVLCKKSIHKSNRGDATLPPKTPLVMVRGEQAQPHTQEG